MSQQKTCKVNTYCSKTDTKWISDSIYLRIYIYIYIYIYRTACYSLGLLTWTYGTVSSGFCSPGNHATNFFNKIIQKLTWNPIQAQTEPELHPETANMEFEQVITKRSATLKGDLKVNLEPTWFLRRFPWKFHVSDFRATLLFTSYCAHILSSPAPTWHLPGTYPAHEF